MKRRINLFSSYYQNKYKTKVGKIALTTPYPCPWGKCIFCNEKSFAPYYQKISPIKSQLEAGKKYLKRKNFELYLAYFQQGTPTVAKIEEFEKWFKIILKDEKNIGIIISTRPEYLKKELLELITLFHQLYPQKEFLIEIGLQSWNDETLKTINRGHTLKDFLNSYQLLENYPFIQKGIHLIWGLPGETKKEMNLTLKNVISLRPQYLKFHHLQIITHTKLAEMYQTKEWKLWNAEEYLTFLANLIPQIPTQIVLHRLWATSSPQLLIAPHWNLKSYQLYDKLEKILKSNDTFQGKEFKF